MRTTFHILTGVIIGVLISGGAFYFWGANFSSNYNDDTSLEAEELLGDYEIVNLPIPKSLASEDYYREFNNVVNRYNEIVKYNTEDIAPLLEEINVKSKAGEYVGLVDLIFKVKSLNKEQIKIILSMKASVESLDKANINTPDIEIKSLTEKFILIAREFAGKAFNYIDSLDKMLSSAKSPTEESSKELEDTANSILVLSEQFNEVSNKLIDIFTDELIRLDK